MSSDIVTPENLAQNIRHQIARWMTMNDLDIREASIACANTFTRVAIANGTDEALAIALGERIVTVGAEWMVELLAS